VVYTHGRIGTRAVLRTSAPAPLPASKAVAVMLSPPVERIARSSSTAGAWALRIALSVPSPTA
jgi:hypothetical protein